MKTKLLTNCLIVTIMLTWSSYLFASTTYRVSVAQIRTPNLVGGVLGSVVSDLINEEINYNIKEDDPADGYFDASFLLRVDETEVTYMQGLCEFTKTKPLPCTQDSRHMDVMTTSAKVPVPDGNIFDVITSPDQLAMSLMGIEFELDEPRISWIEKKNGKIKGSVTGFISQQDAENIHISSWVPFIGGWSWAEVFEPDELKTNSDGVLGWWFVLDFKAKPVNFIE